MQNTTDELFDCYNKTLRQLGNKRAPDGQGRGNKERAWPPPNVVLNVSPDILSSLLEAPFLAVPLRLKGTEGLATSLPMVDVACRGRLSSDNVWSSF